MWSGRSRVGGGPGRGGATARGRAPVGLAAMEGGPTGAERGPQTHERGNFAKSEFREIIAPCSGPGTGVGRGIFAKKPGTVLGVEFR